MKILQYLQNAYMQPQSVSTFITEAENVLLIGILRRRLSIVMQSRIASADSTARRSIRDLTQAALVLSVLDSKSRSAEGTSRVGPYRK